MANVFSNPSGGEQRQPAVGVALPHALEHARGIGLDRLLEDRGVAPCRCIRRRRRCRPSAAPIADERAAEVQPALDRAAPARARCCLRDELAEDDLLGEVLRADADHGVARGRAERRRRSDGRQRDQRQRRRAAAQRPAPSARRRAARARRAAARRRRVSARSAAGIAPGEDHGRIDHRQAAEDVLAEPAGADRRGDRRGADADHRRDADAGDDRRQRQRQLDLPQQLPRRHAQRRRRPRRATRSTPRTPATVVRTIGSSA